MKCSKDCKKKKRKSNDIEYKSHQRAILTLYYESNEISTLSRSKEASSNKNNKLEIWFIKDNNNISYHLLYLLIIDLCK